MSQDKIDFMEQGPANADLEKVKLKVPPKVCVRCGGKYIPLSNAQKICPICKGKEKQRPHSKVDKDRAAVFGGERG